MVAYPDHGEGNDPEPFFFFLRGVCSLSQPRLNIFTVDNMRVMICLGQGGLRSLSASSLSFGSIPSPHHVHSRAIILVLDQYIHLTEYILVLPY